MTRRNQEGKSWGSVQKGLVPFLDTLFLLLFALLALSDSRTAHRSELVRVDLPEVEPAQATGPDLGLHIVLEIDAQSRVRVSEGPDLASREDLDRLLAQRLGDALPEEVVISIHADRDARHGVAVELLQHLLLRGFVHVQMVAQGRIPDPGGAFGGAR